MILKASHMKVLPALLLLLLSTVTFAQTYRASVRGTVYDPNRAVVGGAEIRITNKETGESRTTTSSADGEYTLSSPQPGPYRLEIAASGFATFPQEFSLAVNQGLR